MLFHFSEDSGIQTFIPRKTREDYPAVVWAIDEDHSVNYYFPRECPRVIFTKSTNISADDMERFFGYTTANTIITVETGWYERINNATIFKYSFNDREFDLLDGTAGYYISPRTIEPVKVEPMNNLIDRIVEKNVELRITPNLYPLRNALIRSSIDDFSIIRFRNAMEL
ncbi:DUF6886 family protein [Paenibacillus tarimensis]